MRCGTRPDLLVELERKVRVLKGQTDQKAGRRSEHDDGRGDALFKAADLRRPRVAAVKLFQRNVVELPGVTESSM